jgi:selenocysteine lyase/cysteine desulfurase
VAEVPPAKVYQHLADRGVNAPAGTFYAYECARLLGIEETGAVRAGIAPYTEKSDVDRLLEAVADIAG